RARTWAGSRTLNERSTPPSSETSGAPGRLSLMPTPIVTFLEALAGDFRFAVRYFARHKGTTAIIVAVIALGTGANAVIFSMFQSMFLRPAPAVVSNPAHVRIWAQERPTRTASWKPRLFTRPELAALAARRDIFADVAAWTEDEVVIGGDTASARAVQ